MNNTNYLRNQLYVCIDGLMEDYSSYIVDVNSNHFSRTRKLPLKTLVESILFMGSNAIKDELYDFFDFTDTPTTSAFVQQRQKLKSSAFRFLFDLFNEKTYSPKKRLFKGYRLLAVDGSSIPISHDPSDKDTYIKQISKNHKPGKGHNAFHITGLYDLMDHTYTNVFIQGEAQMNENDAFNEMITTYNGSRAIFITDRGFESLNSFVYAMKSNQKYLIRTKDMSSLSSKQRKVFDDILICRTEKMGFNSDVCENCGNTEIHYNSCKNSSCPICQSVKRYQWIVNESFYKLNIKYFHIVFTIPSELNPFVLLASELMYSILLAR